MALHIFTLAHWTTCPQPQFTLNIMSNNSYHPSHQAMLTQLDNLSSLLHVNLTMKKNIMTARISEVDGPSLPEVARNERTTDPATSLPTVGPVMFISMLLPPSRGHLDTALVNPPVPSGANVPRILFHQPAPQSIG